MVAILAGFCARGKAARQKGPWAEADSLMHCAVHQNAHGPKERHDLSYCQTLCCGICVASSLNNLEMFDGCLALEPVGEFGIYPDIGSHELLI